MKIVIAYIPVLHEGYRQFLENHCDARTLYIFGREVISHFDYLRKEIRALDPRLMKGAIESLGFGFKVKILNDVEIAKLKKAQLKIVIPREDVTVALIKEHFTDREVIFDDIFLRWDKHLASAPKPVEPDIKISVEEFDRKMIREAKNIGNLSSCWWRRVGAVVVRRGKVVMTAYNKHTPSEHTPYIDGDPRNVFKQGVGVEYSTSFHAEARIMAEAAKRGISLDGCELYCSDFPCPPCAKLVAYSGIKKLYYNRGYGALNGREVLKSQGVEIVYVEDSGR